MTAGVKYFFIQIAVTATDYTVIIAAISLGVVQALGIVVQIVSAWRASDRVAGVASTLEKVHTDTNGNLSKLNARLESLERALAVKTEELAESRAGKTKSEEPQNVTVVNPPTQPVPTAIVTGDRAKT